MARLIPAIHFGGTLALIALLACAGRAAAADQPRQKITVAKSKFLWSIGSLAFSPDGKRLAIGCCDAVHLYDAKTGVEVRKFNNKEQGVDRDLTGPVAISPDGKLLLSGLSAPHMGEIRLWNIATGKAIRQLGHVLKPNPFVPESVLPPLPVGSIDISADGKLVLLSTVIDATVYDAATGAVRWTHKEQPRGDTMPTWNGAVFSPDGKTIAGIVDGSVQFWDTVAGTKVSHVDNGGIFSLALSADGQWLAFNDDRGDLTISSRNQAGIKHVIHGMAVYSDPNVAISKDSGTLVVAGAAGQLLFIDPATGKQQASLDVGSQRIEKLALSPDGATVATVSEDDIVRLWDTPPDARRRPAATP